MSFIKEREAEREFILECIEVYRSLPALWDSKCKDYNNRVKKDMQYEILLNKYREKYPDADKSQLVKKINSLRTNFRKEWRRIKQSLKNGSSEGDKVKSSSSWYFNALNFIINEDELNGLPYPVKVLGETSNFEEEGMISFEVDIGDDKEIVNTANNQSMNHKIESPNKKPKRVEEPDVLITKACNQQHPQSYFDKIAAAWVAELQKMRPQQQLFAKKAINDILFEGQMGTLHRDSVQINCTNRASSPIQFHLPSPKISGSGA